MTASASLPSRCHAPAFRLRAALFAVAVLVSGCATIETLAAPSAELWPRWQAHEARATTRVDHAAWDRFLASYLAVGEDGVNRLAYARVTPADRQALRAYLETLAATPVSRLSRAEQFAYWINLYNALTVHTVLERYPVRSIRDISTSPGLFAIGPWGRKAVTVEGEAMSLDDIEHRILRPIWRDPRVHYALNCAALGCPNLQARAFTAANAEAMLDTAARAFVNHPRGVRIERGRLLVSSIYEWFKVDFGGNDSGVIAHLRRYARPELEQQLAGITRIADHSYDWALNAPP